MYVHVRLSLKKNGNIYLPFCWELFLTSTISIFNDWFITVPSVCGSITFRAKWIFDRLKIYLEIFNLAVDLPKDKFNIIANIFHYHKEKFAGVKPGLQQCESISNTFGTYHNQGFVYLSTRHASDYIEKRIGNLMNSTINRGSSGRVHVDIDQSRLFIKTFKNILASDLQVSR